MAHLNPDPFDFLLTLEDDLYTTAYAQGAADGSHAGRIEGRIFGLEKGFDKFAALGQLHGRAAVWGARLPSATTITTEKNDLVNGENEAALPTLSVNERLKKHIQMLHALTDPATFSTLNTEDAVADFDDRSKRGRAKAKIIERIVGETGSPSSPDGEAPETAAGNIRISAAKQKKGDDSIEDFVGSRFLS
ncbi:uncharacterized protein N0V89_002463 [Didymosphaeria variabile]|uniref:Essential protein Yae1 N-terminal domain-containing protein n=1 Tax=Didymosphaeria variabile TaxID=1932322 RepID=A0A9W8XS44_9PLEO|nr:uncharacterized protein N0V89_002463 [Didymosphaeria variabile]KAJ4357886.1 hypothetical protein N0V89_002463 [Didymosphaeria variabile]